MKTWHGTPPAWPLHDTDLLSGSQPFYQVLINGKLYKAFVSKHAAELAARALRKWQMDATIVAVGERLDFSSDDR